MPLYAYCADAQLQCLVYPLIAGGSLDVILADHARRASLTWQVRLNIACGVLRALDYLHGVSADKPCILHR